LLVLFLSDGRPSDKLEKGSGRTGLNNQIVNEVGKMCTHFGSRLTFGAFGFAHDDGDMFELMKKMVEQANKLGSKGVFASGLETQ